MWRAYADIQDEYASLSSIIQWWDKNQNVLRVYQGKGDRFCKFEKLHI